MEQSAQITMELAQITNTSVNSSLLPSALEVANTVLRDVVNVLVSGQQPVDDQFQQVWLLWHHIRHPHPLPLSGHCHSDQQLPSRWPAVRMDGTADGMFS